MDTVLFSPFMKTQEKSPVAGWSDTHMDITGDPAQVAIIDAVVNAYPRRIPEVEVFLDGQPITLLWYENALLGTPVLVAREGNLRRTTEGDIAILPKGARVNGYLYLCDPSRVLDYESGYNRAGILAERVAAVRAALPVVQTLTIERLAQLPRIESQPDECTLALFGTWRSPFRPTETWCWGALWLLYGYDPEDDLAAGVLFLRPQCGLSEHRRSITRIARQRHCYAYGRHLLRFGGGIVAARAVPVRDALAWTNVADHDTVLAYVSRRSSKKPCSTTTHVSMRQDRCSDDL